MVYFRIGWMVQQEKQFLSAGKMMELIWLKHLISSRDCFVHDNILMADNRTERELRNRISWMWNDIEWNWFTKGGEEVLYWHWSPNNGWAMNFPVRGFNECLIMYVLAASAMKDIRCSCRCISSWLGRK